MGICSVACLPMALFGSKGAVVSAIALPLTLAWLATTRIGYEGEYRFEFESVPGSSLVELRVDGGRQSQAGMQGRILLLGLVFVFATLVTFGELSEVRDAAWFLVGFAALMLMLAITSTRRFIDEDLRVIVTRWYWVSKLCIFKMRWQVQQGDYLSTFVRDTKNDKAEPEFRYCHTLCVCRGRRKRILVAGYFKQTKPVAGVNTVGERLAKKLGLDYRGYNESKRLFWFPV